MRQYSEISIIGKAVLALVLAFIPLSASAQSACPIQPVQVKDTDSQLAIDFRSSNKSIASYRFALVFFDHGGHPHAFPQTLAGNVQVPGQSHRTAIWQNRLALQFLYPYAQAFVQQVTFADGTSWADDGSHSCSIISVQE